MVKLAIRSQGRVHLVDSDGGITLLDSPFANSAAQTALEISRRNSWKTSTMMKAAGMEPPAEAAVVHHHLQFTAMCAGERPGSLLYVLQLESAGGVFEMGTEGSGEKRLFHLQDFLASDLTRHPETGFLACSVRHARGNASIMTMNGDGSDRHEITAGDCIDEAPSWVPGAGWRIVYQSAGVSRSKDGFAEQIGPASICRIDLENSQVETLCEDPAFDFLAPQQCANGDLYFIRRPYKTAETPGFGKFALDVLLIPYRLLVALYAFLNVISLMLTQKPLMNSLGRKMKPQDQAALLLRGRYVATQDSMRQARKDPNRGIVPDDWELVRRDANRSLQVIARGVLAYQLGGGGDVVYTNGRVITSRNADGATSTLARHDLIEEFCVLPR